MSSDMVCFGRHKGCPTRIIFFSPSPYGLEARLSPVADARCRRYRGSATPPRLHTYFGRYGHSSVTRRKKRATPTPPLGSPCTTCIYKYIRMTHMASRPNRPTFKFLPILRPYTGGLVCSSFPPFSAGVTTVACIMQPSSKQ